MLRDYQITDLSGDSAARAYPLIQAAWPEISLDAWIDYAERINHPDPVLTKAAGIVAAEGLEVLHPEFATRPRVYYKNLYRYARCFIAGSLAAQADGVSDCVAGARVVLFKGQDRIAETVSDAFGDFKLDRLEEESGGYRLEIDAAGRPTHTIEVILGVSQSLGTIDL